MVTSTRYVRLAVVTCVLAAIPAILGFQLLASHLGQTSRDVVNAGCVPGRVLRAVGRPSTARSPSWRDQGLLCRTKPGLTDNVVFEWKTTEVTVVDFATALKASSNSEGWIRRYCMPAS